MKRLVEIVAMAMHEATRRCEPASIARWDGTSDRVKNVFRFEAECFLKALRRARNEGP